MPDNKTVLITGCSSGIGRATAYFFHLKGWNVIATMRSPKPDHKSEFYQLENMLSVRLDVLDKVSISNAIKQGIDTFGHIDVLINNAGYGAYGALEVTEDEEIEKQLNTNVLSMFHTSKRIIPHFRARRQGVIINVGSMVGKFAVPLGSLYCSSKFAVEGFSEALSYEMEAIGVKVKLIEPGAVKTDFASRSLKFSNDEGLTEYQALIQSVLQARGDFHEAGISPKDVAAVIYNALHDDSARLRYPVGPDAQHILGAREKMTDVCFMNKIRTLNGLSTV